MIADTIQSAMSRRFGDHLQFAVYEHSDGGVTIVQFPEERELLHIEADTSMIDAALAIIARCGQRVRMNALDDVQDLLQQSLRDLS